jgi:hypothetical protein
MSAYTAPLHTQPVSYSRQSFDTGKGIANFKTLLSRGNKFKQNKNEKVSSL